MTTCMDVFNQAMGLMDEVNENSGATDTVDTKEYKVRTLFILNTLRGELYPYSDTYKRNNKGKRPICPAMTSLTDEIDLDDFLCQTVMPYGLAAHLLMTEDPASASFFQQRYEELLKQFKDVPANGSEAIDNVYGAAQYDEDGEIIGHWYVNEYGEFSRWG